MIEKQQTIDRGEDSIKEGEEPLPGDSTRPLREHAKTQTLVRLRKSIVVSPSVRNTARIDEKVVSPRFYSSFNYWMLPKDQSLECLTLGVTSPNAGDGKTVVAANLAVSFALANGKNTLLVDLNPENPSLHKVFDVPLRPGLFDALQGTEIHVTETAIKNLNVLTFGEQSNYAPFVLTDDPDGSNGDTSGRPLLGLEYLPGFRDLVYSLQQNFEVVIFDLPPVIESGLPGLYLRQIDGIIVVVRSGQTRKEEIDRVINQVDESHIRGFVINRVGNEFSE